MIVALVVAGVPGLVASCIALGSFEIFATILFFIYASHLHDEAKATRQALKIVSYMSLASLAFVALVLLSFADERFLWISPVGIAGYMAAKFIGFILLRRCMRKPEPIASTNTSNSRPMR